ncbi:two-component system sensor histidine kinase QseC [Glaesserella parasuis]|uniref:Sensor protein QseC n=1 Tax=Glaesserella parasuis HPS10 TaxID=1450514 RepID=A0A836MDY2_GLAPU|nr:quorum sensing histidine kinase QseC [Glaesserella parasuis]KDB47933.1 sensor protein QseC [Glaesserella parasuis HPS10]MCT8539692.1 two-component system sensor histidine kinase QseC [Glaesserella parasuis]MCT8563060.1 two-component system sensor histidine kinase QseC [Glaesserella parasuis]MCT8567365.1 two-component system sensor histidine kinase QseC [Glaesserella parasuis]MCT8589358.1 two-component system sensor histidine kinase QseC [Glaesserella parasuis]
MKLLKNTSLRFRLMIVISCTALLIWLISTAVAWVQVRHEVDEVFDAQQVLFAQRLASSDLRTLLMERKPQRAFNGEHHKKSFKKTTFDDDALAFAIFNAQGERILSDGHNGANFPFKRASGFTKSRLNHEDDDEWRIFWLPISDRFFVAVGQEQDYRDDLIQGMVFSQMWIWFASLPLLLGLIVWVIKRELLTLQRVGEQVQQRTPDDNSPLSTAVPKEILPVVTSLNQFFDKTSTVLLRERRFTSDAAHELRSPLAALKIQTEIAQLAGDDTALREKALHNLTQGINRATQLIEQLLTLSRLDNLTELEGVEDIHWEKLIPSLVGELYFQAQKREMEIEFEQKGVPAVKQGQPLLLSLMLRNLVDNAMKYCPQGTTIRITLEPQCIIVEDNGGGVDEADLAKLGQRFYRPAGQNEKGSGLGLSIVRRIAELHGYYISMDNVYNVKGGKGLRAIINLSGLCRQTPS